MLAIRPTEKMNLEKELPQRERAASSKQSSNDEGRPQDLQIGEGNGAGKITPLPALRRRHASQKSHPPAVDIQDNRVSIRSYQEPPPELKWDKNAEGLRPGGASNEACKSICSVRHRLGHFHHRRHPFHGRSGRPGGRLADTAR